jgi:hypothetical protein
MITEEIRNARETIVLGHLHDESRHAWDDVLATFPHPRYELVATGKTSSTAMMRYVPTTVRPAGLSLIKTTRSSARVTATTP